MAAILAQQTLPITAAVLFYIFAAITAFSAIAVMVSQNIVRMAVFLLFTLSGVAGLYFMLSAEFLAAVQLVVYVGGTLILIIFGVMLTSKSPFSRFQPKRIEVIAAVSLALLVFLSLVAGIMTRGSERPDQLVTTGGYPMLRLGQALMSDFLIPFEVVSVLLLVVMIGAAYLAKGRKRQ